MKLRSNYLSEMNDPREKKEFAFGGVNVPYAKIYKGYYSHETHIDRQFKLGKEIKERIQVICFSGANEEGWSNEMMWAHYGDGHRGVCIEIDEEALIQNTKSINESFKIDNIDYSEEAEASIYWINEKNKEENITNFLLNQWRDLAFKKSSCWRTEDEKRLMIIREPGQVFIPIDNAVTRIYLGTHFGNQYLPSIKSQIPDNVKLSRVIYQHYKFEKWDV